MKFRTELDYYRLLPDHTLEKVEEGGFADNIISWARWMAAHEDVRQLALDKIGDVEVSTVFLGFDHGISGPPLLFETMIFNGPRHLDRDRYSTWQEAMDGHAAMVAEVRKEICG